MRRVEQNVKNNARDAPSDMINASDCDDKLETPILTGVEICDNQDNDCNAEVDDGIGQMFCVDILDGFTRKQPNRGLC